MPRQWKTTIDIAAAAAALDYDADTGVFRWRPPHRRAGDIAGCLHRSTGYWRIGVGKALLYGQRLAWLMHHGIEPSGLVDHINGDRLDNRIANLRDVLPLVNSQNKRVASLAGVRPSGRAGWAATLTFRGRPLRVPGFRTQRDAHDAFLELRRRLYEGHVDR